MLSGSWTYGKFLIFLVNSFALLIDYGTWSVCWSIESNSSHFSLIPSLIILFTSTETSAINFVVIVYLYFLCIFHMDFPCVFYHYDYIGQFWLFFTNFLTNYLIMILVILMFEKNFEIHTNDNHELKRKKAEELQSRILLIAYQLHSLLSTSFRIALAVQESRPTKRQKRSANSSRSHSHSIHSASFPSLPLPSTSIPALLPPSSSFFFLLLLFCYSAFIFRCLYCCCVSF